MTCSSQIRKWRVGVGSSSRLSPPPSPRRTRLSFSILARRQTYGRLHRRCMRSRLFGRHVRPRRSVSLSRYPPDQLPHITIRAVWNESLGCHPFVMFLRYVSAHCIAPWNAALWHFPPKMAQKTVHECGVSVHTGSVGVADTCICGVASSCSSNARKPSGRCSHRRIHEPALF